MNSSNWTNSSSSLEEGYRSNGQFWFLAVLFWFGIAADCFIIFLIKRTPTLKSYTGILMISHMISDIGLYLVSFLLIMPRLLAKPDTYWGITRTIFGLLGQSFHGITSQTLAASSLNLYFAICHSTSYMKGMSTRYVAVFVPVCWAFNIFLCMIPLAAEETRKSLFISKGPLILQNYVDCTYLAWTLIVTTHYVVPALVTTFALVMTYRYSQKIQPITNANLHYLQKYRLSQIITGISLSYIGMWSMFHMFRVLEVKHEINTEKRGIFGSLSLGAYMINLAYDTLKLFLYMAIYKPFRNTVMQLMRCKRFTPVETIQVRGANQVV